MHSAHPSIGVSVSLAARQFACPVIRPRKVFEVASPRDRTSAGLLRSYLADYFGEDYSLDWNCAAIDMNGICDAEINPSEVDCLILFGHSSVISKKNLEQIHDYWQCGGSLVALRIGDFSLHGASQFADDIFGGEYQFEHSLSPVLISPPHHAGYHPLLRGIQPFVLRGGLHRYDFLPNDAAPMAFGSLDGETVPAAWARSKLGRRVFATTLGAPADFRHPLFLRLLANAVSWTAR
jgi:hypothetical protein